MQVVLDILLRRKRFLASLSPAKLIQEFDKFLVIDAAHVDALVMCHNEALNQLLDRKRASFRQELYSLNVVDEVFGRNRYRP